MNTETIISRTTRNLRRDSSIIRLLASTGLFIPFSDYFCRSVVDRYEGCWKSTDFDNSPRYVKFDQKLAPLLEVGDGGWCFESGRVCFLPVFPFPLSPPFSRFARKRSLSPPQKTFPSLRHIYIFSCSAKNKKRGKQGVLSNWNLLSLSVCFYETRPIPILFFSPFESESLVLVSSSLGTITKILYTAVTVSTKPLLARSAMGVFYETFRVGSWCRIPLQISCTIVVQNYYNTQVLMPYNFNLECIMFSASLLNARSASDAPATLGFFRGVRLPWVLPPPCPPNARTV